MNLLHFTNRKTQTEFVMLTDDVEEAVKEHAADGYRLSYNGELLYESGDESMLPSDRPLTP